MSEIARFEMKAFQVTFNMLWTKQTKRADYNNINLTYWLNNQHKKLCQLNLARIPAEDNQLVNKSDMQHQLSLHYCNLFCFCSPPSPPPTAS
jgi:hypothetical protein